MTRHEDEAQQVVADIVVKSRIQIGHGHLFRSKVAAKLFVLAVEPCVSAEVVNRAMLRGSHEPGSRVVRDA